MAAWLHCFADGHGKLAFFWANTEQWIDGEAGEVGKGNGRKGKRGG